MVVYKITNSINGKSYIGQTIRNVYSRWKEHVIDKRNQRTMYNALGQQRRRNKEILNASTN